MPGIKSTVVGYTGGEMADPTYRQMGDHTEALMVEYEGSYEEIVEKFFAEHTPLAGAPRQYRSAIFYHDDDQRQIAEAIKKVLVDSGKKWCAHTAIEEAGPFYRGEEYHQHYLQKMINSRTLFL